MLAQASFISCIEPSLCEKVAHTNSSPSLGVTTAPADIQRGFPRLPESGSEVHVTLLKEWIRDCDTSPTHKCTPKTGSNTWSPTRLLDVVEKRLNCLPEKRSSTKYVALSHLWGDENEHKPFCTYRKNVKEFQGFIDFSKLPQMFTDAVAVTRNLGVRYLWIDSLCIIQEDPKDWNKECQRMEYVFNSAYVTIAASCASGVRDGFLKSRPFSGAKTRRCHALNSGIGDDADSSVFYVCDAIDDFKRDVEHGALSKRGWVYQERALSRRTIHFTETQTYWECGAGIRCETLTMMFNRKSSFLSDPEFPNSALGYYKGLKIRFFEEIYEKYSQLNFTKEWDRSEGMAGLERRLVLALKTRGRYGVLHPTTGFDSFFGRSLLWQRDEAVAMLPRIKYVENKRAPVPSWSWMAVMGPIKYVNVEFDTTDWKEDVKSPFTEGPKIE